MTRNGGDEAPQSDDEEVVERVAFSWPERSAGAQQWIGNQDDWDPQRKLLAMSLAQFLSRPDPTSPWQVTVTWRFTDEEAIPIAVEVRSNSGPITAREWRTIRVQEVIDASRRRLRTELQMEAMRGDLGPDISPELAGAVFEERSEVMRRPGRPRHHTDAFLAEVAQVYAEAVAHRSRRPVREVAEHFAGKGESDASTTAKGWVSEARRRGFIPREDS